MIHNYHFCTDRNSHEISSKDTNKSSGDKFQHKWLTDPELAQCGETHEWCLLCIKGKGMFSPLCRQYDVKQSNGLKQWNSVTNKRFRTQTVKDHFQKSTQMPQSPIKSSKMRKSSYFDKQTKKKTNLSKNEVYYKVFHTLYWIAKEEIATVKCNSFMEKMGVDQLTIRTNSP